jgi:omega-amidase
MPIITVSLAQINIKDGDPRKNWVTVNEWTTEAARRGSDIVIFPELWDNGFALEHAKETASTLSGGLFAQVTALSRSLNIHIFGSMLEKRGVGIYNSAAVFTPRSGIMGAYRKIHLFEGMSEGQYLTPGESPLSVDLPWGATGFAICYDLRFPELFRRYFNEGAKVVVLPAEWPAPRIKHWRALIQARAIENQCFMLACNRVGEYSGNTFPGHSMIVDPWGELVCEAGDGETMMTVKIDTDLVDQVRAKLPVLQDRRPALYGI